MRRPQRKLRGLKRTSLAARGISGNPRASRLLRAGLALVPIEPHLVRAAEVPGLRPEAHRADDRAKAPLPAPRDRRRWRRSGTSRDGASRASPSPPEATAAARQTPQQRSRLPRHRHREPSPPGGPSRQAKRAGPRPPLPATPRLPPQQARRGETARTPPQRAGRRKQERAGARTGASGFVRATRPGDLVRGALRSCAPARRRGWRLRRRRGGGSGRRTSARRSRTAAACGSRGRPGPRRRGCPRRTWR